MPRSRRPAIDKHLAPQGGVSRDGQPLSHNRAPRAELSPWIARLYVTDVTAPADHAMACGLFNDTAFLRIQMVGNWTAETADGPLAHGRAALFFGPQSHRMPVAVTGSFCSIGISLRPGACHVLKGPKIADYMNRIVTSDTIGLPSDWVLRKFDPAMTAEEMADSMEQLMAWLVDKAGGREPDPATLRFETACFTDPNMSIGDFAKDCGIEQRRLERIIRRDFGMPPKQVLRRARALDLASHLRGVADQAEAEALALRYYDQSHLIREFTELFGMSPSQFVSIPQPLMTLALESRQARRLESISRITPGELRPWQ